LELRVTIMSARYPRGRFLVVGLMALATVATVLTTLGRGEPPRQAPAGGAQAGEGKALIAAATCKICHGNESGPSPVDERPQPTLHREGQHGTSQDKHNKAYERLNEDQSKKMGKLLGIDVTRDKSCLGCHATDAKAEPDSKDFEINTTEGVSCVAC